MRTLFSALTKRGQHVEPPLENTPSPITRDEIATLFAAELGY
jgi:hypothetical protein